MRDAIVVGCGIIGATVSHAFRGLGLDVRVIDDNRPMSGTAPSGGHLKPSWFGDMPKQEYEPSLQMLEKVWGLQREEFAVIAPLISQTITKTEVYRVDTDVVVRTKRLEAKVTEVITDATHPHVQYMLSDGTLVEESARIVVVATGSWIPELFPRISLTSKQGVSFRFQGKLEGPFIKPWAPYKQIVAHQQGENEIWVGDGSAIIPKNWDDQRTRKCLARCRMAISAGNQQPRRVLFGLRPYAKSGKDPCLLEQVAPNVWVATGAGKSGTIAAGWVAWKLQSCLA